VIIRCSYACLVGPSLIPPNVKHDLPFHRPSPVVGSSRGVGPPHGSVHFGFDDRPLGAFACSGATPSRSRDFPALAPLVICPPSMFDFAQPAPVSATAGTLRACVKLISPRGKLVTRNGIDDVQTVDL